jgi:hypothetical protein
MFGLYSLLNIPKQHLAILRPREDKPSLALIPAQPVPLGGVACQFDLGAGDGAGWLVGVL